MKAFFSLAFVAVVLVSCSALKPRPEAGFRCFNPNPIECEEWEGGGCCPPTTACRYTSQYGAECVANSPTFGASKVKQSPRVKVQ